MRGRIVAELDDYDTVRELVADLFAEGLGATVPPAVREAIEEVATGRQRPDPDTGSFKALLQ